MPICAWNSNRQNLWLTRALTVLKCSHVIASAGIAYIMVAGIIILMIYNHLITRTTGRWNVFTKYSYSDMKACAFADTPCNSEMRISSFIVFNFSGDVIMKCFRMIHGAWWSICNEEMLNASDNIMLLHSSTIYDAIDLFINKYCFCASRCLTSTKWWLKSTACLKSHWRCFEKASANW